MAKKRGKHSNIWHSQSSEASTHPPLDLELLGCALKCLPPTYWKPSMLFRGALDLRLREVTGTFPATLLPDRRTHPLFVLERLSGLGHRVCPCSSKNFGARRRIRHGCVLIYTQREMDRDSHLVESCAFNLPLAPEFWWPLHFMGLVPPDCLESCTP